MLLSVAYQLISHLKTFIRQIKYVSTDIKNQMNQIETLSMVTLCESNHLSNELDSVEFGENEKLHSTITNGSSDDGQRHCPNVNEMEQPLKNVTFDDGADVQCTPSIASYFCIIHDNQQRKMKNVEHLFEAIGPILIKLECLVLDTSTGELDNMRLYYNFWENQLFELLIRYF